MKILWVLSSPNLGVCRSAFLWAVPGKGTSLPFSFILTRACMFSEDTDFRPNAAALEHLKLTPLSGTWELLALEAWDVPILHWTFMAPLYPSLCPSADGLSVRRWNARTWYKLQPEAEALDSSRLWSLPSLPLFWPSWADTTRAEVRGGGGRRQGDLLASTARGEQGAEVIGGVCFSLGMFSPWKMASFSTTVFTSEENSLPCLQSMEGDSVNQGLSCGQPHPKY